MPFDFSPNEQALIEKVDRLEPKEVKDTPQDWSNRVETAIKQRKEGLKNYLDRLQSSLNKNNFVTEKIAGEIGYDTSGKILRYFDNEIKKITDEVGEKPDIELVIQDILNDFDRDTDLKMKEKNYIEEVMRTIKEEPQKKSKSQARFIFEHIVDISSIDQEWAKKIIAEVARIYSVLAFEKADIIGQIDKEWAKNLFTEIVSKYWQIDYGEHSVCSVVDKLATIDKTMAMQFVETENNPNKILWNIDLLAKVDKSWTTKLVINAINSLEPGYLWMRYPNFVFTWIDAGLDKKTLITVCRNFIKKAPELAAWNIGAFAHVDKGLAKELFLLATKNGYQLPKALDNSYNLSLYFELDANIAKRLVQKELKAIEKGDYTGSQNIDLYGLALVLDENAVRGLLQNENLSFSKYLNIDSLEKLAKKSPSLTKAIIEETEIQILPNNIQIQGSNIVFRKTDRDRWETVSKDLAKILFEIGFESHPEIFLEGISEKTKMPLSAQIDTKWAMPFITQAASQDAESVIHNAESFILIDREWGMKILNDAVRNHPYAAISNILKLSSIDKEWAIKLATEIIQNNPEYILSNMHSLAIIDKAWAMPLISTVLKTMPDKALSQFRLSETLKEIDPVWGENLLNELVRSVLIQSAKDERYTDLIPIIVHSKEISHTLKIAKHLIDLDYPPFLTNGVLERADFLRETKNPWFYEATPFWELFGKDFRKTDAKIGSFDPKQLDNTKFEAISRYLESAIESGHSLKKFDIHNVDAYTKLFELLKTIGATQWEKVIFDSLDFSGFKKFTKEIPLSQTIHAIRFFANTVHPQFQEILMNEAEFNEDSCCNDLAIFKNPKTGRIDVTQNNIGAINSYLELFTSLKNRPNFRIENIIKKLFPSATQISSENALDYFIQQLDVEEINFQKISTGEQLAEVLLLQKRVNDYYSSSTAKYLRNKVKELDVSSIFTNNQTADIGFVSNLDGIENLRTTINANTDRVSGDKIVIDIASAFLRNKPISYDTFKDVWRFASTWQDFAKNNSITKDVAGLYKLGANFAFNMVARFLQQETQSKGESGVSKELEQRGMNLNTIINELNQRGIPFEIRQSNFAKGITRIAQGQIGYVMNKASNKLSENNMGEVFIPKVERQPEVLGKHSGIQLDKVLVEGKEKAKLISCDPSKSFVKLLMDERGMVDMKGMEGKYKGKLIFSAPLAFTTGDHKMTEMAINKGNAMNYLISTEGKDGIVIADKQGDMKILKKTELKLSDFGIPELLSQGDRALNITHSLDDYREFLEIMKKYQISLLSNMLLVDNSNLQPFGNDQPDSRRFLVTFPDGRFGILNSTENMSTREMMAIAVALKAERAVYMDTGMYDMATYYEPNGKTHILGHIDTNKSTNRVVIMAK